MRKKSLFSWFLTFLILILFVGSKTEANSDIFIDDRENPISVSASERVDYYMEEGLIIAQGDVVLIWGEYTLKAPEVLLNLKENFITASQEVYFSQGASGFHSDELTFYFEDYKALILKPHGHLESEAVAGTIYIRSDYLEASEGMIKVTEGKVSTCDREKPHYYLRSKRVDIYPGDKFTAHHVSFWELSGYLPLFYWPRLTVSLKDREQKITPEIGYSSTRGWFIKTSFNYLRDKSHGFYMLDFYSKTGLAGGIKHFYLDDSRGTGYFQIYAQQDQIDLGLADIETLVNHNQKLNENWQTNGQSIINYYEDDKITIDLQNTLKGKVKEVSIDLEARLKALRNLKGEASWPSMDTNLTGRFNYSLGRHRFYLDSKYNMLWQDKQEELLKDWAGLFRYNGGATALTYQVTLERRVPALGSTAKNHFYKIPEVNLKIRPGYFKFNAARKFRPFYLDILVGHYDEGISKHKATKAGLSLNYSQVYRPLSWTTINLDQRGTANYYSSGEEYFELYSRNRLTLQPLKSLRGDLTYTYRSPFGETPFRFDSVSAQEDLMASIYYTKDAWSAQVSSGWNIKNEHYFDIIGQLRYHPSNNLDLRLSTGYNLQEEIWRDVILAGRADYNRLQLTAGYRFGVSPSFESKNLETQLAWQIIPDISLKLLTIYDFTKEDLSRGEAQLAWNFHCRELIFSYEHLKGEFWVQYHINAFPGQKLKLGLSSEDPMLVDIDLGDLLPW